MKNPRRVAFVGNHLPRRCGIATFTHDLNRAITMSRPDLRTAVVAMTDRGCRYEYSDVVRCQVRDDVPDDYVRAAQYLNNERYDVVSLQHEYGIFGGVAGGHILELLTRLDMPVVTTLHTVLPEPSAAQHKVMSLIIDASAKIVVMSEIGREFLSSVHGVAANKIDIIPHGIPDFPFLETHHAKAKFGFTGRTVILTFGLLSPNKGIGKMLDAMPSIIKACPSAVYVVLGATHPNLIREQGEIYRDSLKLRVQELGIGEHVVFLDQFVDQATLLDYISMCDVYVTPYLNVAQMTSGTLAYSFGLGKAVVSTPYWHAKELLADGRGILVPFADANALGTEIAALLTNDDVRNTMRKRAYAVSRTMTWAQTAKLYLATFDDAREDGHHTTAANDSPHHPGPSPDGGGHRHVQPILMASRAGQNGVVGNIKEPKSSTSHTEQFQIAPQERRAMPAIKTGHFLSMCDSTGLMQHAVYSVPDRAHGYCVDDNGRALLLACALDQAHEPLLPAAQTTRFAAFVQHAWNPDTQRFRNFMSYDRRWLEPQGSEDSHGRTLWALGACAGRSSDPALKKWAASLFEAALPVVDTFSSPRAWAFTLLGLDAYCKSTVENPAAERIRCILAERLMTLFAASVSDDWVWFEDGLAYDNARLPQALIQTGRSTQNHAYTATGLRSLRWLMEVQTAPAGFFRPVGSHSFGKLRQRPDPFDQQAVEAAASISACLVAQRVDPNAAWASEAWRAFRWFLGDNDLRTALIDPETGGCLDGLHPDRPNENMGAESVLSYLLGLVEMRHNAREIKPDPLNVAANTLRKSVERSIGPRIAITAATVASRGAVPHDSGVTFRSGVERR